MVWGPLLAAALVAAWLAVAVSRAAARRKMLARFDMSATRYGLADTERAVLTSVATLAELVRFSDVFLSQPAFERGLARLMESQAVLSMSPAARRRVRDAVEALRAKLGFVAGPAARRRAAGIRAALDRGTEVRLVRQGETEGLRARVASIEGRDVALVAEGTSESLAGQACLLRRGHDGLQWEFRATVVVAAEGLTVVRLIGEPRSVNLRRFARAETRREAYVAHDPLFAADAADPLPRFRPATLTQIGGPGLRLTAPLQVTPGERVLTLSRMESGARLLGVGQVRRVLGERNGSQTFAVELVGLSEKVVGHLVRDTNAALRRRTGSAGPAEALEAAAL